MAAKLRAQMMFPRLIRALVVAGPVCFFVASISGCGEALPQPSATQPISAGHGAPPDRNSLAADPPTHGDEPIIAGRSNAAANVDGTATERPDSAAEQSSTSIKPPSPPGKPNTGEKPKESDKSSSEDDAILDQIFAHRETRAPSLDGGVAWINSAGPIDIKDLRGKFVVLDFWTFCCINCMHIIPELKQLESRYPNNLVVIGVHSAKFEAEQDSKNITDAVLRYEIEHPVVNDAHQRIWNRYDVESWPTLVLIDPEGYLLFKNGGEVKADLFDNAIMKKLVPYYRKKGLLDEKPLHFNLERFRATQTPLRFPSKIAADEARNRIFISDSNHNRIVVARLDGQLLDVIGSGETGKADGDFKTAQFNRPQGMALEGETLYVADTENHLLRKIDLKRKQVVTIAGTGKQAENGWPGWSRAAQLPFGIGGDTKPERFVGPPRTTALSSPWDVVVSNKSLFIAMAGTHQIWKMPLDESEIGPYAGNSREDIVDGPLLPSQPYTQGFASFAQPSGLAVDGKHLYVADSEGSSIRDVPLSDGEVSTIVGTADLPHSRLFTFGDVDGSGAKVRLQHPLGIAVHNGLVYIADTYNNKIKVLDPSKRTCRMLSGGFNEPSGLCYAAGKLYVADTNNHLIRTIDLEHGSQVATLEIRGLAPPDPPKTASSKPSFKNAQQVTLPEATVKPADGAIRLAVKFTLPAGYKMNPLAPMRYFLEAEGPSGPIDRSALGKLTPLDHPAAEFEIKVPVTQSSGRDTLKLSMNYYYCQTNDTGLCKIGSVVWTIPVTITGSAATTSVAVPLIVEK
jgi:thiol-disulfide isomerase/thioredoxin